MKTIYILFLFTFFTFSFSSAQSSSYYDITFTSTWNANEHNNIPNNAHWSRLVGATHKEENIFLEIGTLASNGIKAVAELGQNSIFMSEVENSPNSKEWFNKELTPYGATGSATLTNVEFTLEHHLITLVSMVAPSPDWFMAVNSLNLRNDTNTAWKDSFTVDVFVFDAGTDGGTDYDSPDNAITPIPISKINGYPFSGNKIGTLTVTQNQLSVEDFQSDHTKILISPNPTSNHKITIKTSKQLQLRKIEIFDAIGKQLKVIQLHNVSEKTLELNSLKSGLYIAKIFTSNGEIKTKKLLFK